MLQLITVSFLLLSAARGSLAQILPVCGVGCFQGTPQNASTPGDASLCPLLPGAATPFLTSSCLCFTPESFSGPEPSTYCFTCGQQTTGDFSTVCGGSQVTQTCSNQQDVISKACNANSDINTVLGSICQDGSPTPAVAGIETAVDFVQPELAAGAFALVKTGCQEIQIGQTISNVVSQLCNVWDIAGCTTADTVSGSGSTGPSSPSNTGTGKVASTSALGKAPSTSARSATSTGVGTAGSTSSINATAVSPGTTNIASTSGTGSAAASTNTAPAGSSSGTAPTLPYGMQSILYSTFSLVVASLWILLV